MNPESAFSASPETSAKVSETLQEVRNRANGAIERGAQQVRERPGTSLLSAFLVGAAVGAVVAIALRPEPKGALETAVNDSHDRLADLFGSVADQLRDPLRRTYNSVSEGANGLAETLAHAVERLPKFGR